MWSPRLHVQLDDMGVQVSGGKQLRFFSFQQSFFKDQYQLGGLLLSKFVFVAILEELNEASS